MGAGRADGAEQCAAPACRLLKSQPMGVSTPSCTQRKRQRCSGLSVLRSEFRKGSRWWFCHSTGMLSGTFHSVLCTQPWQHAVLTAAGSISCGKSMGSSRNCASPVGGASALCPLCQPSSLAGQRVAGVTSPWLLPGVTSPRMAVVSHPHGWCLVSHPHGQPCCHIPTDDPDLTSLRTFATSPRMTLMSHPHGRPQCHVPMATAWYHIPTDDPGLTSPRTALVPHPHGYCLVSHPTDGPGATSPWITPISHPYGQLWPHGPRRAPSSCPWFAPHRSGGVPQC